LITKLSRYHPRLSNNELRLQWVLGHSVCRTCTVVSLKQYYLVLDGEIMALACLNKDYSLHTKSKINQKIYIHCNRFNISTWAILHCIVNTICKMYERTHTHTHTDKHARTFTHTYIHTYINKHTHTHIYIHTYTYKHTHKIVDYLVNYLFNQGV